MSEVKIEGLLKRCSSVYKLVILAAKRAKEVSNGAPALVEAPPQKVTSVALEEILQGKVLYKVEDVKPKPGKKGRGAKGKAEKRKKAA